MAELTQWEYFEVDLSKNSQEYMNQLGAKGWELVTTEQGYGVNKLIFKRPKQMTNSVTHSNTQSTYNGYGY
ncbi:MAG: DUF4177 domain-containing protein [Treponemataceae bacterium]|nr:DUF4177 domain-containing protein [Treponemataceae bacterium]